MLVARFMTHHPVTVTPDTTLDEAFTVMDTRGFRHLPVVEKDEVVGVVSDRDLRLGTGGLEEAERNAGGDGDLLPQTVRDIMRTRVICVGTHDRGPRAAAHMVAQRIGALPVLEDGRLVGIITETNLVSAFRDLCRDPVAADEFDRPVEEIMHTMVVTLSPTDTLDEAVKRLTDWRIRHIPVMKDEELVGIVSDRDIRLALGRALIQDTVAQSQGRFVMEEQRVESLMSNEVVTIDPRHTLSETVDIMLGNRISALPVELGSMLVGIVTRTDILVHYASVA